MALTSVLLRYLLLINLITFIIRGIDKYKSVAQKRRVSEKHLLMCVGIGGWLGAIFGMQTFRHKTIKGKFLMKFRLIAALWIVITIILLFYL